LSIVAAASTFSFTIRVTYTNDDLPNRVQEIKIMANELRIFKFEGNDVRTVIRNDEPLWILKDVCDVLGLNSPHKVAERLDEDERNQIPVIDSIGRSQETTVITESGLYNVILRSDKPEASRFRKWVTSEVLPEIRKTGGYMIASNDEADEDIMARALIIAQRTIERRNERIAKLEMTVGVKDQQIAELQPKASYYDVILNTKDAISVTKIAKDYGKSAVWLNGYLHDKGIQFKQGDVWLLYAKYAEQGYTSTKTHVHPGKDGEMHSTIHTYWTQKGRLFLYDLLKQGNILPLVEREDTQTSLVA
jgi:prophage antirepressor-like protein